jgi:hypothetical protein
LIDVRQIHRDVFVARRTIRTCIKTFRRNALPATPKSLQIRPDLRLSGKRARVQLQKGATNMRINRFLSITAGLALAFAAAATWAATTPASLQNQPTANSWMQDTARSTPGVSGWAVVSSNGRLARGKHAASVVHTNGSGNYQVYFSSNIRSCSYTATIGMPGHANVSGIGFITVVATSGSTKGVYIDTYNSSGTPTDLGFHLNVAC